MTTKQGSYNALISTVAKAYNFSAEYCEVLEKWIIKGNCGGVEFYWDSNQSQDDFFYELRHVFNEEGAERVLC